MQLEGKVALITGGSAGIGLAVAHRMAAAGARVVLVARGQQALNDAVQAIGDRAAAIALDVSDLAAVAALPARVVASHGRLDVLVNNAGLHHRGDTTKIDAAALGDMVTVNLTAPIVLARAALDHLPRGGAIVNIASIAGYTPLPGAATYCATKAGLRFFTLALANELEERGIRVATVNPGPVDTGFFGDIEDVSPLVFSQPMSTVDTIADGVLRALDDGPIEVPIPARSAWLASVAYLVPTLGRWMRPRLIARGEVAKRAYMARKKGGS